MSQRERNQNAPDSWVDDLQAGEAKPSEPERDVVQVNEQSDMATAGGGRPVRESHQPADPSPHSSALATTLALIGIIILVVVGLALLLTGTLGL